MQGKTEDVINFYLSQSVLNDSEYLFNSKLPVAKIAYATKLNIEDIDGNLMNEIPIGKPWRIKIHFTVREAIKNLVVGLGMNDMIDIPIRTSWSMPNDLEPGNFVAIFTEDNIKFNQGQYKLIIGISRGSESIEYIDNDIILTISDVVYEQEKSIVNNKGGLIVDQMKTIIEQI